jgi:hypothetical protein
MEVVVMSIRNYLSSSNSPEVNVHETFTHAGVSLDWVGTSGEDFHEFETTVKGKWFTFDIFESSGNWIVRFNGEEIGGGDSLKAAMIGTCEWFGNPRLHSAKDAQGTPEE